MARTPHALVALLVEGGLPVTRAAHLVRNLDRLRLAGLGSDDLAALLLGWAARRYADRIQSGKDLVPGIIGDDIEGQLMLFKSRRSRKETGG